MDTEAGAARLDDASTPAQDRGVATFDLSRRAYHVALGAVLVAYAVLAARYLHRTSFVADGERVYTLWDDAMISMRYAHNLATGHGLVWNDDDYVQGYSNLGLTLVMAAIHLLPVSQNTAPLVFQLLSIGVLLAVVYMTAELTTALARSRLAGACAAVTIALFAPLGIWGVQGADSAALALVLVIAARQVTRALETGAPSRWLFPTLAIGVLVRLDFAMTYAAILAFLVWELPRRGWVLLRGAGTLLATLGGMLLFGLAYYGDPLPNTYYLKATGIDVSQMVRVGLDELFLPGGQLRGGFTVSIALFAVYGAVLAWRVRAARVLVAAVLLSVAYFVRIGGDWTVLHMSRFLVQVIPIYVALILAGAWQALHALRRRPRPALAAGLLVAHVAVLVASLNRAASIDEWWSDETKPMYKADNERNERYARLLCDHTSEDTRIGVFWAGLLPYQCDRTMVDLLGKTDRHIAKGPAVKANRYWPGHAKRDWDYILDEQRPDILVSDMPEMKTRPDYLSAYCPVSGLPLWIAMRKESFVKLHYPGAACL